MSVINFILGGKTLSLAGADYVLSPSISGSMTDCFVEFLKSRSNEQCTIIVLFINFIYFV